MHMQSASAHSFYSLQTIAVCSLSTLPLMIADKSVPSNKDEIHQLSLHAGGGYPMSPASLGSMPPQSLQAPRMSTGPPSQGLPAAMSSGSPPPMALPFSPMSNLSSLPQEANSMQQPMSGNSYTNQPGSNNSHGINTDAGRDPANRMSPEPLTYPLGGVPQVCMHTCMFVHDWIQVFCMSVRK
jgi:hypothetical protein